MKKCIIPFSGGMDSTTLLQYATEHFQTVYAISFKYGQRHLTREAQAINKILKWHSLSAPTPIIYHNWVDISFFRTLAGGSALTDPNIPVALAKDIMGDPQTVNYVPFRNMMMLSICCAYAETVGADTVFHGAAQADSVAGFWDGSKEFIDAMNNVNMLNRRHKIKIEAPLLDKSKAEIIRWGNIMGVDYSNTWTCYNGEEKACGECTACSLRLKGFIDAGMKDPIDYSKEIPWDKLLNAY
jgi:7-cyano-7-deazaguanine synthase